MPRQPFSDAEMNEVRSKILVEVGHIISTQGYVGLSMRKLASTLGLTAGALYRYFPGKHHVVLAYCINAIDQLTEEFARILAEESAPLHTVERMLIAYGDFAMADADRFRVLFLDPEVTTLTLPDSKALESYALFQEAVERVQAEGALRPLPVSDIVRILWASVHGVCALAATVADIDFGDTRALVAATARNALRGLLITSEEI